MERFARAESDGTNISMKTATIEDAFAILAASDDREYIGEAVSQLEHALQAAHFARQADKDPEVVLACLFHDIGHLCAPADAPEMDGLGVMDHEDIGARFLLSCGFSERLAELVRGHVQAKRYLVAKKKGYRAQVSAASQGTLEFQGGPMDEDEMRSFEEDPLFREKVFVRVCDERAKDVDLKPAPLESYRDMARGVLVG